LGRERVGPGDPAPSLVVVQRFVEGEHLMKRAARRVSLRRPLSRGPTLSATLGLMSESLRCRTGIGIAGLLFVRPSHRLAVRKSRVAHGVLTFLGAQTPI